LIRDYKFVAIGALLGVFFLLAQEDLGIWALLPVGLGVVGVLLPWTISPILVLVTLIINLTFTNILRGQFWAWGRPHNEMTIWFMPVALFVYLLAHCRLVTLTRNALPIDRRRERVVRSKRLKGRWFLPREVMNRTVGKVGEIGAMLLNAPIFALTAYVMYLYLVQIPTPQWVLEEFPQTGRESLAARVWLLLVILWSGALFLMLLHLTLSYLRHSMQNPEEARLSLQEELWHTTRGEQRSIWRWLVWARLRKQKRAEEKSS
jgi:hypothetical protein